MDFTDMGNAMRILLNLVGSVGILGLGVFGLLFFGRAPEVPVDAAALAARAQAPAVETAEIAAFSGPFQVQVDGEASTWRVLTVSAEVGGRIQSKTPNCRSGSFVSAGDVLFEIDRRNYELDEQRLQARLLQAQEELNSIDVDLASADALLKLAGEENDLQKAHLARVQTLFQRKATSETELDNATRQELASRNSLQLQQNQRNSLQQSRRTKEAGLKLVEAELARCRLDLERCTVRAPIAGRIVQDTREDGDFVKAGDPLVQLSDGSRMEVRCSLRGEELSWVWRQQQRQRAQPVPTSQQQSAVPAGSTGVTSDQTRTTTDSTAAALPEDPLGTPDVPCEVVFEFEGSETIWDARLSRYEGTGLDRATRTFPCRVVVERPAEPRVTADGGGGSVSPPALLSGMFVTVRIPIEAPMPLFRVPPEALRPGGTIWLVRGGRLLVVNVSLVQMQKNDAIVHQLDQPLADGDRVIVSPLAVIQDGMPVQLSEVQK
ncbi:MAG: efflux RND transporter periplasmic adaptor subunit [Planctomyces sp.]